MLNAQLDIPLFDILKLYKGTDVFSDHVSYTCLAIQTKILGRIVLKIKHRHIGADTDIGLQSPKRHVLISGKKP